MDIGAGKTSLVVRFVENNFHSNLQSTIGASFLVKKVYAPSLIEANEDKWMIVLCDYKYGIQLVRNGFGLWLLR
jgi:GTPase SAR1 family protein